VIRTNLSTRPFYNARAVRALLGVFAAVVIGMTAYNAIQLVRLATDQRTLGANAAAAERKAAREANAIIDQRTFSWTEVLAHFERTLPSDVRITSVQQQSSRQGVLIEAEARNIGGVDAFIEALEKTGSFRNVTPRSETAMENDTIVATLEATYVPQAQAEAKR
jgi:Tfp pilus assembly protein PilN